MDTNVNKKPAQEIILRDMQIPYNTERWQPRNFRGLERIVGGRMVNGEGKRNFCIFLPSVVDRAIVRGAKQKEWDKVDCDTLIEDGWNISKSENPTDPMAEPSYMLRVKVKYHPVGSDLERLNPKVLICTQNGEMEMDEENIGDLDNAQIIKAALTVRASWQVTPSYTGYVAYLEKIVVRVYEDEGGMEELKASVMED